MNYLFLIYIPGLGFILSLVLIPLIKKFALNYDLVAVPQKDRWHKKPTPILGGAGIFVSWIIVCILFLDTWIGVPIRNVWSYPYVPPPYSCSDLWMMYQK